MPLAISNRYAQALVDTVFAPASAVDPRQISAELHAVEEMVQRVRRVEDRFVVACCFERP